MIGSLHSDLYRAIHLPLLPMLLYVQSMSPRWLSLSSCFYLVNNFARVSITQLYKYHASLHTGTRLKESTELDGNIARAFWIYRRPVHDSIYALRYLAETGTGAMPLWQYVHSVFDSLLLSSFGPKLLLDKYVAMLSRRGRQKSVRHSLTTTLAVCSVFLSNKATPRCNPEFVGVLSGKFTSTASNVL